MLLCESFLPDLVAFRKRYLKPGGIMIPSAGSIHIASFSQEVPSSIMHPQFKKLNVPYEARVMACQPEWITSSVAKVFECDFQTEETGDCKFSSAFSLEMLKDCTLEGFVCWFDVDMGQDIMLSTSPTEKSTHWAQTLLPWPKPVPLKAGEVVKGRIEVEPREDNHRALSIKLEITIEE